MYQKRGGFSPKDIAEYVSNLYEKIKRNLPLTGQEDEFLTELPDDFVQEVDVIKEDQQVDEPPITEKRVKRVKKKKPDQPELTEEEIEELVEEAPELGILNTFFPGILDDDLFFDESHVNHMDASLNTFIYLRDLGYTTGMWSIGPEHKTDGCHPTERSGGVPVCDYLNSAALSLDVIIDQAYSYATAHSFYPPKAIVAQSHPGCYSSDTKVMTKEGLKYFKDVIESDLICSMNPETREIEYVKWVKRFEYPYKGKMFHYKARGFDAIVTPNHNMIYSTYHSKTLKFKEAQDLQNLKHFNVPRTAIWKGKKASKNELELCKFFGWYLSEGCITKRKDRNSYQVSIAKSIEKKESRERIEEILNNLGLSYGISKNAYTIQGDFARWIYEVCPGKSHEKKVPNFIKEFDIEAIGAFLNEYSRADGHRRVRNCFGYPSTEVNYYTSSLQLVSDLSELIIKSGKSLKISLDKKKGTISNFKNGSYASNYDCFALTESNSKNSVFYSKNKSSITEVEYDDFVYCFELEKNHILLFEREGYLSWCGNCKCHILCFPPDSPEGIPDTAPGVRVFGDAEEILQSKQVIFERLRPFPVDRWTVLSPVIYDAAEISEASIIDDGDIYNVDYYGNKTRKFYKDTYGSSDTKNTNERFKFSDEAWIDSVKPIKIKQGYMLRSDIGPVRPIPETYIGFQLSTNGDYAKVFLGNIARTTKASLDNIEDVTLVQVPATEIDSNYFVKVDDSLGIVIRVLEDGKAECYLPDFDSIIMVQPNEVYKVG